MLYCRGEWREPFIQTRIEECFFLLQGQSPARLNPSCTAGGFEEQDGREKMMTRSSGGAKRWKKPLMYQYLYLHVLVKKELGEGGIEVECPWHMHDLFTIWN
jgi:hypothetical protein